MGLTMKKKTEISNFHEHSSLQELGVKLDNPVDFQIINKGRHSITLIDHTSLCASGILESGENYNIEVEVGNNLKFDGVEAKVVDIVFPHVMLEIQGDKQRIHVVELVACLVREG